MPSTRSSVKGSAPSSPATSDKAVAGQKRKSDSEGSPKQSRKAAKKQITLEETLGGQNGDDSEMKNASASEEEHDHKKEEKTSQEEGDKKKADNTENEARDMNVLKAEKAETKVKEQPSESNKDGATEEADEREQQVPSNILEKGVIYFFTRNRVGIEDADSVGDLSRTYFVLRPLPKSAKLGDGALPDLENNRLLALPKKTFPKSHNDRFMAFVEKAPTTIKDLKENFFSAEEYETETLGTRRTEPVTPVAEGVYAITRTDDATTHLAYSTTIPSELGEVQEDLGIKSQGSFIISAKNPERSGPASAQLPHKPNFPKEIIEEFRNLAWSEVKPKYLDYAYCQILLIGENIEKALEPTTKDQKHDKETPEEELGKLEHEDMLRVKHLQGDDPVFHDFKISKDEYPKVPTTW